MRRIWGKVSWSIGMDALGEICLTCEKGQAIFYVIYTVRFSDVVLSYTLWVYAVYITVECYAYTHRKHRMRDLKSSFSLTVSS